MVPAYHNFADDAPVLRRYDAERVIYIPVAQDAVGVYDVSSRLLGRRVSGHNNSSTKFELTSRIIGVAHGGVRDST